MRAGRAAVRWDARGKQNKTGNTGNTKETKTRKENTTIWKINSCTKPQMVQEPRQSAQPICREQNAQVWWGLQVRIFFVHHLLISTGPNHPVVDVMCPHCCWCPHLLLPFIPPSRRNHCRSGQNTVWTFALENMNPESTVFIKMSLLLHFGNQQFVFSPFLFLVFLQRTDNMQRDQTWLPEKTVTYNRSGHTYPPLTVAFLNVTACQPPWCQVGGTNVRFFMTFIYCWKVASYPQLGSSNSNPPAVGGVWFPLCSGNETLGKTF